MKRCRPSLFNKNGSVKYYRMFKSFNHKRKLTTGHKKLINNFLQHHFQNIRAHILAIEYETNACLTGNS